jgi:hypothetical protein
MFKRKPIPTEIRRNCDELLDIYAEINDEVFADLARRYGDNLAYIYVCLAQPMCTEVLKLSKPRLCPIHPELMMIAADELPSVA